MSRREDEALSFGSAAAAYRRARPGYPGGAVDWVLGDARRVVDLGAGTGQLTRLLAARGLDVIAVEPSAGMRSELARALPDVPVLVGTAESMPLPDADRDAVLAAQSWHWADPAQAVPEVARVLRPGGRIGLLWNVRDEREPWVAELGALLRGSGDPGQTYEPRLTEPFAEPEHRRVTWTHRLPRAALVDLVASRSYVITMPADDRAALLERVRALAAETTGRADDADALDLPYVTDCWRATRS